MFGRKTIFHDRGDIMGGANFPDELKDNLGKTRVLVVIVTPDFSLQGSNDWVAIEIHQVAGARTYSSNDDPKPVVLPLFVATADRMNACKRAWGEAVDRIWPRQPNEPIGEYLGELAGQDVLAGVLESRPIGNASEGRSYASLIQAFRHHGIRSQQPHRQNDDETRDFTVCVCGDLSTMQNDYEHIRLNLLARALFHLRVSMLAPDDRGGSSGRLRLVVFHCPGGERPQRLDVAALVSDYLKGENNAPAHSVTGGNWWRLLADLFEPEDIQFKNERDPWRWARGEYKPRLRAADAKSQRIALFTFGILLEGRRKGVWSRRPRAPDRQRMSPALDRLLREQLYWIAFPKLPDRAASVSHARFELLRKGVVDATTLALSSYMIHRLEDHTVYMSDPNQEAVEKFSRELFRILRALVLAPLPKSPRRWWLYAAAASLVLIGIAISIHATWRRTPEALRFCGSGDQRLQRVLGIGGNFMW